jgi:hypothetical protein
MNNPTTTLQTVLISAGVTLVVGVLSVLGAYLLERSRRRATDRRWLLDRRHEAYMEFLQEANSFIRSVSGLHPFGEASNEHRERLLTHNHSFESAAFGIRMLGADGSQRIVLSMYGAANRVLSSLAAGEDPEPSVKVLMAKMQNLMTVIRVELQPPRLFLHSRDRFIRRLVEELESNDEGDEAPISAQ